MGCEEEHYHVANNEILLFLHEEAIELVYVIVQQAHELILGFAIFEGPIQQRWCLRYETHELLQFLVRQVLVPPLRQRLLNLLLQSLSKLHNFKTNFFKEKQINSVKKMKCENGLV